MGPIRYANPDFDQMRQNWIRMEEFADLDEFSTYLNKLGEFAAAEIKKTLPAIRNSLGTRPGAFKIGIFQGKDFNFIALAKAADQFTLVWSCWQSEEAQEEQERALAGGKKCLEKLAVLALAGRKDVALKFAKQEDRAFMWKAPSVHPLQVLENAFQRIVHKEEGAEAQSEALARYFMQNSGQPVDFKGARRDDLPGAQLAAVKMNHMIEPFYLFRLLVQYTAESAQPIDEELRIDLSSALTKLLHNGDRAKMAWLSAWLTKKIAELGKGINALNKEGERRVLFFVKGGRALNYFLGTREKGENDWDTQVVIDPRLPAMEWYQCFSYVHDTVLAVLGTFAAEFTRLVVDNAGPFMEYLESLPGPKAGDDEEIDENEVGDVNSGAEHASCKAELIDIGIPRRDSPSALEEWLRLSARDALSTSDDGVIYPTREYYLNEYLTMARETFLPDAPDVRVAKAPKRLTRFGQILNGDPEALSEVVKKRLAALPKMAERRLALTRRDRKVLFASLVSQFVEAYNLVQDTELATLVDAAFLQHLANPPPLPAKLANTLVDDAQKVVAGDVCMAHTLAENMREHWRARNGFFEDKDNDTFFLEFVRHLAESTSGALKNAKAQFAIAGSYAARLHAKHLRAPVDGLEPIRRVLVKLQCPHGQNEADVLKAVRGVIVEAAEKTGKLQVADVPDARNRSLVLKWHQEVRIGTLTYAPLVMKIRGAAQPKRTSELPVLASIDGLPVLDLRYIAADYLKKTAKIDELRSRETLKSAVAAVSEMMSRFDFDSDDDADDDSVGDSD